MNEKERAEKEKKVEYFVHRFRTMSGRTNNISLAFLFLIVYTYLNSMQPNIHLAQHAIDSKEKSKYFEEVNIQMNENLSNYIQTHEKQPPQYDKTTFAINKGAGNAGTEKKGERYRETGSFEYITKQKKDYLSKRDSLIQKIKVSFDIPTLKPVLLNIRHGIIFWLALCIFLLVYINFSKRRLLTYLEHALSIHFSELRNSAKTIYQLDIQPPFWLQPLDMSRLKGLKEVKVCLQPQESVAYKLLACTIIVTLLLVIQLHVAWLGWNLDQLIFPNSSDWYLYLILVMLGISLFQMGTFFIPLPLRIQKYYPLRPVKEGRRIFIVQSISALSMLAFVPAFTFFRKDLPLMHPAPHHFKRYKKKYSNLLTTLEPGTYLHNVSKKIFSVSTQGICLGLKKICVDNQYSFLRRLEKLPSDQALSLSDIGCVDQSSFSHVIENHTLMLIELRLFNEALETLRNALADENEVLNSSRLLALYRVAVVWTEGRIDKAPFNQHRRNLSKKILAFNKLNRRAQNGFNHLETNVKYFRERLDSWRESDIFPWRETKLPSSYFKQNILD